MIEGPKHPVGTPVIVRTEDPEEGTVNGQRGRVVRVDPLPIERHDFVGYVHVVELDDVAHPAGLYMKQRGWCHSQLEVVSAVDQLAEVADGDSTTNGAEAPAAAAADGEEEA